MILNRLINHVASFHYCIDLIINEILAICRWNIHARCRLLTAHIATLMRARCFTPLRHTMKNLFNQISRDAHFSLMEDIRQCWMTMPYIASLKRPSNIHWNGARPSKWRSFFLMRRRRLQYIDTHWLHFDQIVLYVIWWCFVWKTPATSSKCFFYISIDAFCSVYFSKLTSAVTTSSSPLINQGEKIFLPFIWCQCHFASISFILKFHENKIYLRGARYHFTVKHYNSLINIIRRAKQARGVSAEIRAIWDARRYNLSSLMVFVCSLNVILSKICRLITSN